MNREYEIGSVWILRYPGQHIYFYPESGPWGFHVKSKATVLVIDDAINESYIKVLVDGKIAFIDKMWFAWKKLRGSSLWSEKVQSHEDCVRMKT